MKILHTSDWNLGKKFYNRDRFFEQRAALTEIINIANDEKADAVLVSGNIFGGFFVAQKYVELFCDTVARLASGGKRAVIIAAGERDFVARLKPLTHLADKQGIVIISEAGDIAAKSNPAFGVKVSEAKKGFVELTVGKSERVLIAVLPYSAIRGGAAKELLDSAKASDAPIKIALIGAAADKALLLGDAALNMLSDYGYIALGGAKSNQNGGGKLYASGSVMDFDFDEDEKGVIIAEITEEGLISADKTILNSVKKLKNIIVSDFEAARDALRGHEEEYSRIIISSDKSVNHEESAALHDDFPLLVDVVFNGGAEDYSASGFINPASEEVFSDFLEKAGYDNVSSLTKIFGAIMEEKNETAKA
ncbi:MAG: hypothetical protein LBQ27_02335 [Clostridiales bacterium]|jgi:DNA repair exonuclease SbcCD nuclease subunit|nr:hypothetical protein [Clostridiales bacterium]